MKRISFILQSLLFTGSVLVFCACSRNIHDTQIKESDLSSYAQGQFINLSIASNRSAIYVNNNVLNYATIAYRGQFPTLPNTSFIINSGVQTLTIRDTLATAVQPRLSFTYDFTPASYYTIFLYDTVNQAKQLIVPTKIVIPSDTTARVRFAHFSYLPGAAPAIDIFSKLRNENVVSGLQYTQVTDFIPYATVADSFFVKQTNNPSIILDTLVFTPARKRSYTLAFRGRYRTAESAATANARELASYINY